MNLFRSEEHALRWAHGHDHAPGETISAAKLWELAEAWWGDRLAPDWRPHTRGQNQAILDRLGLTGPFWQLP
jgi:Alkylmercury lyase